MEEHVWQRHDEVHVLRDGDEEEEGGNRDHVRPIGEVDHRLAGGHGILHPESNELGTGEFLARLHDVGGERDRHDEKKNDVAFQLRLPLQLVRGKRHTAGQGRSAPKEGHRVTHFDHTVPCPLQAERIEDSV